MSKKTYYVTVESGVILEDGHSDDYQFVIEADDQEIGQLRNLFAKTHVKEIATFLPANTPYIPYHDDPANHEYDDCLRDIYRMLHQLGTAETKQHIERMGILDSAVKPQI